MSRIPVRSIGSADPPGTSANPVVQQMLQSVMATSQGLVMDERVLAGAPPWAVMLMNMTQNLRVEVEAVKLAMIRRGVMSQVEFVESLAELSKAASEAFMEQIGGLERQLHQGPNPQPNNAPQDPRRSPTP
jgi:hypothetical protein